MNLDRVSKQVGNLNNQSIMQKSWSVFIWSGKMTVLIWLYILEITLDMLFLI